MLVENGMSHHSLVALLYAFINSCDKVKIRNVETINHERSCFVYLLYLKIVFIFYGIKADVIHVV